MQRAIWVLWPSFIAAGIAEAVFFAVFDPVDLSLLWDALGPSRLAAYSEAFFLFWACTAASSGLTLFLQRTSGEVNRLCPLEPAARPGGCPIREDSGAQRP
jgi:hypothetical protein